jgi:hypothetical protein
MPYREMVCGCGNRFQALFRPVAERDEQGQVVRVKGQIQYGVQLVDEACPSCGSTDLEDGKLMPATGIELGGAGGVGKHYPYFDRALGCEVNSAQHRRWLMKHHPDGTPRDFELRPTDGAWDPDEELKPEIRQAEEDKAVYDAYVDEMTNGPQRAAYFQTMRVLGELLSRPEDTDLDKHMGGTGY